jgi:hypothetical protein
MPVPVLAAKVAPLFFVSVPSAFIAKKSFVAD